jgi:hypothetical protein
MEEILYRKYILYDGQLIIGAGDKFHAGLIPMGGAAASVKGGGRILVDDEMKTLIFYSLSSDYGFAEKVDVEKALRTANLPREWAGYKVLHSYQHDLKDLRKDLSGIYQIPEWNKDNDPSGSS